MEMMFVCTEYEIDTPIYCIESLQKLGVIKCGCHSLLENDCILMRARETLCYFCCEVSVFSFLIKTMWKMY